MVVESVKTENIMDLQKSQEDYWVCLLVNLTNGAKTTEIIVTTLPDKILIEKNHQNKYGGLNIFVVVIKVGPFKDCKVAEAFHNDWSKQSRGSASRMKKVLSLLNSKELMDVFVNGAQGMIQKNTSSRPEISVNIIPYMKSEIMEAMADMKNHTPLCVRNHMYDPKGGEETYVLYQLCSNLTPIHKLQTHKHAASLLLNVKITSKCPMTSRTTTEAPKPKIVITKRKIDAMCGMHMEQNNGQKRRRRCSNDSSQSMGTTSCKCPNIGKVRDWDNLACSCGFGMMYPSYYREEDTKGRRMPVNGVCLVKEVDGGLLYSLGDMTIAELSNINV